MNNTAAVVTGASSGIDTAIAHALGHAGATVTAYARDGGALQSVVNDIERDGGSTSAICADVHSELNMERLMETAARAGGRVNVLIANAAVAHGTSGEIPAPENSYAAFDDTLRTNIHGVFTAVKEALPYMVGDERILILSGFITHEAKPGMDAYVVSKAAVRALIRQFATGCDRTVTIVDPGLVATDLTDGRGRDPDDVTDLFVWTATDVNPAESNDGIAGLKA